MALRVSICLLLAAVLPAAWACSSADSRIVNKPFEELEWVEKTRSPIALAMSERHFRFCSYLRHAYMDAADAFDEELEKLDMHGEYDSNRLSELKVVYEGYRSDLVANLRAVLFFKPDHRPALYELISILEELWYIRADEARGINPKGELRDLKELESALRVASDFFGRDYEVNYKLGAVLYREGNILKEDPGLAPVLDEASPPAAGDKFRDAQVFLRKCIAVRSMYAEAYHLLGLCLEEEGRDKEAYKFWKLITVVEQVHKREAHGEIDAVREAIYEMARAKVAEYGGIYGPV
jgi:tetratricopeptide (TPR) repeat protein